MANIFCVGDLCIDHYPDLYQSYIGGCAYNTAKHLNDLNSNVVLVAPIGMDKWTGKLCEKLDHENISYKFLKRKENNLLLNVKIVNGEREFKEYEDELLGSFEWRDEEIQSLDVADYILCPYFEEIRPFINKVIDHFGEKIILDLHDCVNLSLTDISDLLLRVKVIHLGTNKFSETELLDLSKSKKKMISSTLGKDGSALYYLDQVYRGEAQADIELVDSMGAGDAYLSRFTYGLVNGEEICSLLESSNNYAASCLGHNGATRNSII